MLFSVPDTCNSNSESQTGHDGIAPDALVGVIDAGILREANDTMFAGSVRSTWTAHQLQRDLLIGTHFGSYRCRILSHRQWKQC